MCLMGKGDSRLEIILRQKYYLIFLSFMHVQAPLYNCTWKSTHGIEAKASIFNEYRTFHNLDSFFTLVNTYIIYFSLIFW
jgi:hypothetical protein